MLGKYGGGSPEFLIRRQQKLCAKFIQALCFTQVVYAHPIIYTVRPIDSIIPSLPTISHHLLFNPIGHFVKTIECI